MEKLNQLNFDHIDLTAPNIVIEELSAQIEQETNGIIKGSVETYSGPIESYTKKVSSVHSLLSQAKDESVEFDIQTNLGKVGDTLSTFEFYLCTPCFEQYKYRVCFFQYGVANYPVKVVLEHSVANSSNIKTEANYIVTCNSRAELEILIVKIMSSKRIIDVMQELIHINQIYQSYKSKNTTEENSNFSENKIIG